MKETARDPIENAYYYIISIGANLVTATTSDPSETGVSAVCSGNHGRMKGVIQISKKVPYRSINPPHELLTNIHLHLQHHPTHAKNIQVNVIHLAS